MKDQFGREISYLRISVTDKCNFRCQYCMAEDADGFLANDEILTFDEIVEITKVFAKMGVTKVRITGGEPLVRPDIEDLILRINQIEGITDIGITTNGALILDKLEVLQKAGLNRINFSLDSLDRGKFKLMTRRDEFDKTLAAIDKAMAMGFKVKINTVIIGGFNDNEIDDFIALTKDNDIEVRFIELMPIGIASGWDKNSFIKNDQILDSYDKVELDTNGVARVFQIDGYKGKVGLISPLSCKFCSDCNRIRLTADGKLKPCLHSKDEINLRGLSGDDLEKRIYDAIFFKPRAHNLTEEKSKSTRNMNMIGG